MHSELLPWVHLTQLDVIRHSLCKLVEKLGVFIAPLVIPMLAQQGNQRFGTGLVVRDELACEV